MFRSIGNVLAGMGLVSSLGGCSAAAMNSLVVDGQLFCAKASSDGALVVALANASGAPIIVTGMAAGIVAGDCALIDAIPVTPPTQPQTVPVVAVVALALK
jgi:hypothetical protein